MKTAQAEDVSCPMLEVCVSTSYTVWDQEPDTNDYITKFFGKVYEVNGKPEGEVVGRIHAWRIELDQLDADGFPHSVFEVMDNHTQSLANYYSATFDENGEVRVLDQIDAIGPDVLILDSVELVPKYRGRGLGLAVVLKALDVMGQGCCVAILKPYPMQHSGGSPDSHDEFRAAMGYDQFPGTKHSGCAKLRKHWRKLGCKRVPGHPEYCYIDLGKTRPSVQKILASRQTIKRKTKQ